MEDEYNIEEISSDQLAEEFTDDVNNDDVIAKDEVNEFNDSKKIKGITKFIVFAVVLTGSLLVAGSIALDFSSSLVTTAEIAVFEIEATINTISYRIIVDDMDANYLTLNVYNRFTNRKDEIILGQNEGIFENLASNMTYNIDLLENGAIVKSSKITTK